LAEFVVPRRSGRLNCIVTTCRGPLFGAQPEGSLIGELGELLQISRFRMLILVSSSIYGSHAMHDGFAVIWWSAAGIEPSTISILWSEAVAAEVVVFFVIGPALLDRFGARGAAVVGRRGRHCAVVCGGHDNFRFGAFNYPAAARLYLCPASPCRDAHDTAR
jgi:hypothetical protein